MNGSELWSLGAKKMTTDTSTKPLDLERELPSMKHSDSPEVANSIDGDREGQARGPIADLQNDDDDPAKLRERLARLQADFENVRKRSVKEQQEFKEYAVFDAVKAVLPVVDSLEKALEIPTCENADLRTGVEMIHKQLLDTLFKMGVRTVHAMGERFDPRIHHAVATVDTDLVEDGTVVGELQCGYNFKDRLLRPAMVTVARKIPPELTCNGIRLRA